MSTSSLRKRIAKLELKRQAVEPKAWADGGLVAYEEFGDITLHVCDNTGDAKIILTVAECKQLAAWLNGVVRTGE